MGFWGPINNKIEEGLKEFAGEPYHFTYYFEQPFKKYAILPQKQKNDFKNNNVVDSE